MRSALSSELYRLSRRRMPYILLAIAFAVIALLYVLLWLSLQAPEATGVSADGGLDELKQMLTLQAAVRDAGPSFALLLAGIMTVILAASLVATEYSWGTIRALLPRLPGRGAFVVSKLVVIAGFGALAALVSMLGAVAGSGVATALGDVERDLGDAFAWHFLRSTGLVAAAMIPYGALSFTMALLLRSTAAGVGIGLAVFFIESQLVGLLGLAGGAFERVSHFSISYNVAILIGFGAGTTRPPDDPAPGQVIAVLVLYTAVFLMAAWSRFRQRDVTVG